MELDRFIVIFIEPLMVGRELTDSLRHALALVDSIGGPAFIYYRQEPVSNQDNPRMWRFASAAIMLKFRKIYREN